MSVKTRPFPDRSNSNAGNAALDTSHTYIHEDSFVFEEDPVLRHNLNWGDYLRPHHFRFEEASCVRARIAGRPDVLCSAVSIPGAGMFKASESSEPIEFHDGAVIVKAGERVKLFLFDDFRKLFFLEDGTPIESIYQIDFQTPKK